jgi:hypothetical protein
MEIQNLLSTYPRQRPVIPAAYQQIYEREYQLNRRGETFISNIVKQLEAWMHRQVAGQQLSGNILEIGAGTLNHVPYETTAHYDTIEPFKSLYVDSPLRSRLRNLYEDITDIPAEPQYDRLISIAVLEHLERLPEIIAYSALLLSSNGRIQHAIPSEGGALWGLGWRLTTGVSYRLRNGLPYGVLMRHEHINTAPEIIAIIRWFYNKVKIRRFPLPAYHCSFYTYIEATDPQLDRCRTYLSSIATA